MLKVFALLTKLPQLSDAAFSAHWRDPHGTLTRRIPQFRRYVQNHRLGVIPGLAAADCDGIATIWVDDPAALAAAATHPDYAALDADGDAMYIRDALVWIIAAETVIASPPPPCELAPAKAMLLLKAPGGAVFDAATLADRAATAAAALPGVIGASVSLPIVAGEAAFDAIAEFYFADAAAFHAAWQAGGAAALAAIKIHPAASRGFLAREERVIWPQTTEVIA